MHLRFFPVLRPRIHGMSAGVVLNRHVPCVNKTECSPFMLSMRHISHSMLGHTVALSSLEKTVNAFTVFSQVSQNRHNFVKNILAPCFQRGLQRIARRVFLACFQVSGINIGKVMMKTRPSAGYSVASAARSESWTKVLLPKSVYILFKSTVYL